MEYQSAIYSHAKLERVARSVYTQYKAAEQNIDIQSLRDFSAFVNAKKTAPGPQKSDDLLLEELSHAPVLNHNRSLVASVHMTHRPALRLLDSRPATGLA